MLTIFLSESDKIDKKFMVRIENKTIHFGQRGASDYTIHKDYDRMLRYVARHQAREDWTISGIKTAGFWSKHLLWNKTTLNASIKDIENTFNVYIIK